MSQDAALSTELTEIKTTLRALLLLSLREHLEEEELGSVEGLLYKAGFTNQVDITQLTGTPRSTVSRRLKEEGLT